MLQTQVIGSSFLREKIVRWGARLLVLVAFTLLALRQQLVDPERALLDALSFKLSRVETTRLPPSIPAGRDEARPFRPRPPRSRAREVLPRLPETSAYVGATADPRSPAESSARNMQTQGRIIPERFPTLERSRYGAPAPTPQAGPDRLPAQNPRLLPAPAAAARSESPRRIDRPPPLSAAALAERRSEGRKFSSRAFAASPSPRAARSEYFPFDAALRASASKLPARRGAGKVRRGRPLLLSKLLGGRALRPPPTGLRAPHELLDSLSRRPEQGPAGSPATTRWGGLIAVEGLSPAELAHDRRSVPHWDGEQWHAGDVRGVIREGAWTWLCRGSGSWWALADEEHGPLINVDGVWWIRERGLWFVLHEGQAWAWRSFQDWNAQGLFQASTGVEMIYSRDYARAAIVIPGEGADVFDARTGDYLGRVDEERMPPRRRPRLSDPVPPRDVFAP